MTHPWRKGGKTGKSGGSAAREAQGRHFIMVTNEDHTGSNRLVYEVLIEPGKTEPGYRKENPRHSSSCHQKRVKGRLRKTFRFDPNFTLRGAAGGNSANEVSTSI